MRTFFKIVDIVIKIIDGIISFLVAVVILLIILSVLFRYVLNQPLGWVEEICLAIFAWFVFLGSGSALRKRTVVSLDFFYDMFPQTMKKVVKIITTIICLVLHAFLFYLGLKMAKVGEMSLTSYLKISYFYIYLSIPCGCIVSSLALIANLLDVLTDREVNEDSKPEQPTCRIEEGLAEL